MAATPPAPAPRDGRTRRRGWGAAAVLCFVIAIVLSWTEGARDLRLEGVAFLVALVGCGAVLRAARREAPPS